MTANADRRSQWRTYLGGFHERQPGITEDVLTRSCTEDAGMTPYAWLLAGLPRGSATRDPSRTALDLACGSGPLARELGEQQVIGLDRAPGELARASRTSRAALVLGDASTLPFRDGAFSLVACSMALMLFDPVDAVLDEIGRVLRPGGIALFLLPGSMPLTARDRSRYFRILAALHLVQPSYGNRVHLGRIHDRLARAGLEVREDERRRFIYRITEASDGYRFAQSLYAPRATPARLEHAARLAARWSGSDIGIPLRRIACVRSGGAQARDRRR